MLSTVSIEVVAESADAQDILCYLREMCTESGVLNVNFNEVGRLELTGLQSEVKQQNNQLVLKAQLMSSVSESNVNRDVCNKMSVHQRFPKIASGTESQDCLHDSTLRCTYAESRTGEDIAGIASISDRELEVLQQLARGLRNKQVAEQLMLSEKTISTYKTRIYRKLGVSTNIELSDVAKRAGII